jgi:hypothetical protein
MKAKNVKRFDECWDGKVQQEGAASGEKEDTAE